MLRTVGTKSLACRTALSRAGGVLHEAGPLAFEPACVRLFSAQVRCGVGAGCFAHACMVGFTPFGTSFGAEAKTLFGNFSWSGAQLFQLLLTFDCLCVFAFGSLVTIGWVPSSRGHRKP